MATCTHRPLFDYYDSMNRLTSADKTGTTSDFYYDGLGRQVARTINGVSTYSLWDGANRVAEYDSSDNTTPSNRWIYAGGDLIRSPQPQTIYYYSDGLGSTSHIADDNGNLLERYAYDVGGSPLIYAPGGTVPLSGSAFGVDMLFTGQKWYADLGLYDLRARAYLPTLGRFLQPDPIGFAGDTANIYRYCGNNPVNGSDPSGELPLYHPGGDYFTYVLNPGAQPPIGSYASSSQECAAGGEALTGAPDHEFWYQGSVVTSSTPNGTMAARGWIDGKYPSFSREQWRAYLAQHPGSNVPLNHVVIVIGPGEIWEQYARHPGSIRSIQPGEDAFYEVNVTRLDGLYGTSGRGGNGAGGAPPVIVSSIDAGVAGAIAALSAYGAAHGPGIGVVAVNGRVVAVGNVGTYSYGGTTYSNGVAVGGLGSPLVQTGGGDWQTWGGAGLYGGGASGEGFHRVPFGKN